MMIACASGARDCPGYPGQSAQSDDNVGGQHDVSENALEHYDLSFSNVQVFQEANFSCFFHFYN